MLCEATWHSRNGFQWEFKILWSREGGLDSYPYAVCVPNHFVPLKVSHGPIKKDPPPLQKRSFCLEDFWFPSAAKRKKKNKVCLNSKKTKMGDDIETGNNDKSSTEMDYEIEMKNQHEQMSCCPLSECKTRWGSSNFHVLWYMFKASHDCNKGKWIFKEKWDK